MRELISIIALLPLVTWLLSYKKSKSLLSPYNLFSFIYLLNIIIPTIMYADINIASELREPYIRSAVLNDVTYMKYVILQTCCYYLVVFGLRIRLKKTVFDDFKKKEQYNSMVCGYKKYRYLGVFLWSIGLIAFISIMNQVGGIYYFFTHLQYRISMTREAGIWFYLLGFLNYGILLYVYSYKNTNKKFGIISILIVIFSGIMVGLGGRKALLMLIIQTLILYHYTIKKINLKKSFRIDYLISILGVYFFFVFMSKFRVDGAFELFLENPLIFFEQGNIGFLDTIRRESYVTYYMAIIEYFSEHDFWFGSTFWGLITAFIPSAFYINKPPVDDGTYLYSICKGRLDIVPPMSFRELNGSSLPLETFGSMYSNFGIIGLIIGMILLGMIYNYFYHKMSDENFSLFYTIMYIQIIFTFQLSTLRIIQLFICATMLWFFTIIEKYTFKIRR